MNKLIVITVLLFMATLCHGQVVGVYNNSSCSGDGLTIGTLQAIFLCPATGTYARGTHTWREGQADDGGTIQSVDCTASGNKAGVYADVATISCTCAEVYLPTNTTVLSSGCNGFIAPWYYRYTNLCTN